MTNFNSIRQKHRALAHELSPQLLTRVNWSRDQLQQFRNQALKELIRVCKTSSMWHADRLANVHAEDFEESHLASLQHMTKRDLMDNFNDIVTRPNLTLDRCEEHIDSGETYLDDEYCVFASGGSSGVRAVSIFGFEESALNFVLGRRFMMRWAQKIGAFSAPPVSASIGASPGAHGTHHLSKIFGGGDENTYSVTESISSITEGLNNARPDILIVYSSYIPRLLEAVEKGQLKIHPKLVVASAEPILEEHEKLITQFWGCSVFSSWGATETGLMGASSGFDPGLMLYDDHVIIEPVDENGQPVPPGVRADKLFVTPLFHTILPVLRYEITDQLTVLDEPARCGSEFTRTSFIEGRLDDCFMYEGNIVIHPHLFRTVLGQHKNIIEYQIIQTHLGADIIAVGKDLLDKEMISKKIKNSLRQAGLEKPIVNFKTVKWINRIGNAKKLKRFVPLSL